MSRSWALYVRELQALFLSPVAYIAAIVTLLTLGGTFVYSLWALTAYAPEFNQQQLIQCFCGSMIFFWFVQIGLPTAITMRLFAEEKRSGTIETLMTAPVSDVQVVLAKYLGAVTFYLMLWLPTLFFFVFLGSRDLDAGLIASAYLGVVLMSALYIAVGCLISALCTSQIVAAIVCFIVLMGVSFGPLLLMNVPVDSEAFKACVAYVNIFPLGDHSLLGDGGRGLVTLAHLVYPVSAIACCLFLTVRVLESRSWR